MSNTKELATVLADIRKQLGNDDLVFMGTDMPHVDYLSTGWLSLDHSLGGGFPKNQWTELIGLESHGKTAVTLKCIAHNQVIDSEFTVAWIAAEHFSTEAAEMCGVDLSRVAIIDTNVMEDAYDAIVTIADSRSVDMIVLDSYPALVPISEDEQAMEDFQVGIGARLTGKWTRKARKATRRAVRDDERPITGIFINQWRKDVMVRMGDDRTTPGGTGKNYFFYTRVELRRDEWLTEGKDRVGINIMARPIKHKAGRPEVRSSIDYYFADTGGFKAGEYDYLKDLIAVGKSSGVIERRGAYYNFGDKKWQGNRPMQEEVYQDLDLQEEIAKAVLASTSLSLPASMTEEDGEEVIVEEVVAKPLRRRKIT